MNITLTRTTVNGIVTITDTTTYTVPKTSYAFFLFLNNKRSTGNAPVSVANLPIIVDDNADEIKWTFPSLNDGYYKAELVLVPIFTALIAGVDPDPIVAGTVVYHNGKLYKAAVDAEKLPTGEVGVFAPIVAPDIDYNTWEEVTGYKVATDLYVASELDEVTYYGSFEFVSYLNIIKKYLEVSKGIMKNCNICESLNIEEFRCLRDKYEAIELATAATNYIGAQKIIESYENLITSCSC